VSITELEKRFKVFCLCLILLAAAAIPARAENIGVVTIQAETDTGWTPSLNPGSVERWRSTLGGRGALTDADNRDNSKVAGVLSGLRDGDVLVINCHSNTEVFGDGHSTGSWQNFWDHWKVSPRPKLSMVIIIGCLKDPNGNQSTDSDIDQIRAALNSKSIVAVNTYVHPTAGAISMHQIITGALEGKKINPLMHGPNYRFLTEPGVDRSNVTLPELIGQSKPGTAPPVKPAGPSITALSLDAVIAAQSSSNLRKYHVTVQFQVTGITQKDNISVACSGSLKGPGGFSRSLSETFSVAGLRGEYQADSFDIILPADAQEGKYEISLSLSCGALASAAKDASFTLSYPAMNLSLTGSSSVDEGDDSTVSASVSKGTAPYRWEWSGGNDSGNGTGDSFTMTSKSVKKPGITYSVKVWDSGKYRAAPLVRSFPVAARDKQKEIKVTVTGPSETAEGRMESYTAKAEGGVGTLSYEWLTDRGTTNGPKLSHTFDSKGQKQLTVRVWDQGKYKTQPCEFPVKVDVFEKLKGKIIGPDEAEPGQIVTLSTSMQGGKRELSYLWTAQTGKTSKKDMLKGRIQGNPGDVKVLTLVVEDSLNPPQRLPLRKEIRIKGRKGFRSTQLIVAPQDIDQGGAVTVTFNFTPTGFSSRTVNADTIVTLESSSGSGKGWKKTRALQAQQNSGSSVQWSFTIPKEANPGPIKAAAKVTVEGVSAIERATANIRKPSGLKDVTVSSRAVTLRIWDHSAEDGDMVDLYLNGSRIWGGTIMNAGVSLRLSLNPGRNTITVKALNGGTNPPGHPVNSAAISITNVIRGPSEQQYLLEPGASGGFLIIAP